MITTICMAFCNFLCFNVVFISFDSHVFQIKKSMLWNEAQFAHSEHATKAYLREEGPVFRTQTFISIFKIFFIYFLSWKTKPLCWFTLQMPSTARAGSSTWAIACYLPGLTAAWSWSQEPEPGTQCRHFQVACEHLHL